VVNRVIVPTKIAVYVRSVRLNFVLGIARCDESRLPAAWSGPIRRCRRLPPADLRSLYGRFRHRRSNRSETASGSAGRWLCVPNVWPAPDLQVDFYDLVSISLQ